LIWQRFVVQNSRDSGILDLEISLLRVDPLSFPGRLRTEQTAIPTTSFASSVRAIDLAFSVIVVCRMFSVLSERATSEKNGETIDKHVTDFLGLDVCSSQFVGFTG
jgi:hypothetical protein